MSKGHVYILSNPSMPGIVKIGRTKRDVESRASELYVTSTPTPFVVEHYVYCPNCSDMEQMMHTHFAAKRVSGAREFFAIDAHEASSVLDAYLRQELTGYVSEFSESLCVVDEMMALDEYTPLRIGWDMNEHPAEVVAAMGFLTAEEMRPAMARWRAAVNRKATGGDSK